MFLSQDWCSTSDAKCSINLEAQERTAVIYVVFGIEDFHPENDAASNGDLLKVRAVLHASRLSQEQCIIGILLEMRQTSMYTSQA